MNLSKNKKLLHNNFELHKTEIKKNFNGDVLKFLNLNSENYNGFGEVYFSEIKFKKIKGWKMHKKMLMNLYVPHGKIRFIILVNGNFNEIILHKKSNILTIYPKTWFAFQGLDKNLNLLTNFSNILHSDNESITAPLDKFNFKW